MPKPIPLPDAPPTVFVPEGIYPVKPLSVCNYNQILVEITAGPFKGQRFFVKAPFNRIHVRYPRPGFPVVEATSEPRRNFKKTDEPGSQ